MKIWTAPDKRGRGLRAIFCASSFAVFAASATPAAAQSAPASEALLKRCQTGDAYACEAYAWNKGSEGNWPVAAQYAKRGCDLGRATSCSAAAIYQKNYRNHGDQSAEGKARWRAGVVARARANGSYAHEISKQLRYERDLATVAQLIEEGGTAALQRLTFDEVGDLAGQPWEPNYRLVGAYVSAEWRRRDGPRLLAARKRREAEAARPPATRPAFRGVGDDETGTAACSANGRPGKRYQYRGFDGKMVYGPCVSF